MQAMAPGVHGLLHAGHAVGESGAGAGAVGGLPIGAGGRGADGAGADAAGAGALGRAGAAAAPTATGAGAAATVKIFWHAGHFTCLPPALSGIWIALVQFGQRITCGMIFLV